MEEIILLVNKKIQSFKGKFFTAHGIICPLCGKVYARGYFENHVRQHGAKVVETRLSQKTLDDF